MLKQSIIFLTISLLLIYAPSNAQGITLNFRNADIISVFNSIEKQTSYKFWVNKSQLKKIKVTVNLKNASVKEVLDSCMKGTLLGYRIMDKAITISKNTVRPVSDTMPAFVSGIVKDKQGTPLPGVTIRIKEGASGTTTDDNGYYRILARPADVIVFTFIGCQTFEIRVNDQSQIDMTMIENTSQLKETVINGFYNTTKELATGNISVVDTETISKAPVSDPLAALQGRVAGLLIQSSSGAPGRSWNVVLRGRNSIANPSVFSTQNFPLYIIDGIPFNAVPLNSSKFIAGAGAWTSPLNDINPNDIEQIEVLKDADATAIYGSLGANGVILITTKKGKAGRSALNVNLYHGLSTISITPRLMDTKEYLAMRDEAFKNDNAQHGSSDLDYDVNGTWDRNRYTNWVKEIIGHTAHITDAQIALTGGNKETFFRISAGYRDEGTVFPGDFGNKKISTSYSLSHTSSNKKLIAALTTSLVNNITNLPADDMTRYVYLAPNAPDPYNPDGTLNWTNVINNPFAVLKQDNKEKTMSLLGSLAISYELLPGLRLKNNFGYNISQMRQKNIKPFSSVDPGFSNPEGQRFLRVSQNQIFSWILEPQVNYKRDLWNGSLDVILGTSFQSRNQETLTEYGTGYTSDAAMTSLIAAQTRIMTEDQFVPYRYLGYYGKLTYILARKYIINLTARRDGSSRFGPGKRFGNFGAIGTAWIFSNEDFVKEYLKGISFGKLRASYGITGNDKLGDYKFMSTYGVYTGSYQGVNSIQPLQHTNPVFSWERVAKLEVGLELGVLKDNLLACFSIYRNRCDNQLVGYNLPFSTGFNVVQANLPAIVENKGLEIELTTVNIRKSGFEWKTNLNMSFPKNKLVAYPNIAGSSNANRFTVGMPLSVTYRYNYLGIDKEKEIYTFTDRNGDGTITSAQDRFFVNVAQSFFGGINNSLRCKKFQVDFLLYFSKQKGFHIPFNNLPGSFMEGFGNQLASIASNSDRLPYKQNYGDSFSSLQLFNESDATIKDASFLQVKNIEFSYRFSNIAGVKNFFHAGRIYIQCQNLFTITNYTGFNPEFTEAGVSLPPLKTISFGVQFDL